MAHCIESYPERGWNQSSHIQQWNGTSWKIQDVRERTWIAVLCICLGFLTIICDCDWEERVVFISWRNVQNKDGDEKEWMKPCLEAVKVMTEWWSEEGHCDVLEDKKESK